MARVTNPLMSQDARGSVAGVQFSRTRSGSHAGRKSTSTRAQGDRVLEYRSHIKHAHTAWLALSDARKAQWNAIAPDTLTGRNAFIGAALRNLMAGLATPTVDPFVPMPLQQHYPITTMWMGPPSSTIRIDWTHGWDWQNYIFFYTAPAHRDATPHVRKFKFVSCRDMQGYFSVIQTKDIYHPMAIRILEVHPLSGHLFSDRRFVFDPTVNQTWKSCTP